MTRLFIFAGLPGTGKTTLARRLARHLKAVYVRIDTIEQALRDLCDIEVCGEGYRLAYRMTADNLNLGLSVVADSCNPIALTRREWQDVATDNGADYVNIEIVCSNTERHRQRVDSRSSDIVGLVLPNWADVMNRDYDSWLQSRIVIDTAGRSSDACFELLVDELGKRS